MIGNVNSSVQIRKTKQSNFVYFNGEIFEELALHSSVLLFPICSSSSCMCMDFSLCPSCGQRAEVDEWNKKAELEHQIPWLWLRLLGVCGELAGSSMAPAGAETAQEERREQDALHAAWSCDVGLWKKSVTEMKQAQNRDPLGWSLSNQLHVKLSDVGDVPGPPIPTIFYSSLCDLQLCVHLPSLKCPFLV